MPPGRLIQQQTAVFSSLSDAITPLIQQYAARTAPHALMLSGQFGVGKSTLAQLLALALLCQDGNRPCGVCASCLKAKNRSHTNLIVLAVDEKQRSVKVEQARALLASLATHPFSPGPRVVLLKDVDAFTPQAQNALLKAIEEPDPATYFLLTCQNERAVLSTIRSRSQMLRMPPWQDALIQEVLAEKGVPAKEANDLAAMAGGSPGKALAIRDDSEFWSLKALVDDTVLNRSGIKGFPAASRRLKDEKDKAELILDYLEGEALRNNRLAAGPDTKYKASQTLLEAVLTARRQQASNLSWQAVIDSLLLTTLEEKP